MALTVTRARVKEKCAIADGTYDATIDNLIAEMVPVVEFAILTSSLADTGNTGLQATLSLGATEVVCGEFLAQKRRLEHAVAPASGEVRPFDPTDPSRLVARGWQRLRPHLKVDPPFARQGGVRAGATVKPAEATD